MAIALLDDPDFLPLKLDLSGRRVLFVRMSAEHRADAAFLDERGWPSNPEAFWVPLERLGTTRAQPPTAPDCIFHIGHCGSTLLSRVLESWPQLQVLREPPPLKTLAAAQMAEGTDATEPDWQALLRYFLERWATPQAPHQRVLLKATSTCNGLIDPILRWCPDARAIFLDMPLESYLATLFKSETSIRDAALAAPQRQQFLAAEVGCAAQPLDDFDWPEMCAMGWLAEQSRFATLTSGPEGAQSLRVNFDDLLTHPREQLAAVAEHLSLGTVDLDSALASPVWARYSKAQEHAYGVTDRSHDLALACERYGSQIAAGRAWVEAFLTRHPHLASAGLRFD